jgi:hypothetical protein
MKSPGGFGEWKAFCHRHAIAITDLISCIKDAGIDNLDHRRVLGSYGDEAIAKQFNEHDFVRVIDLLENHPTIRNVYLTRKGTNGFWGRLWNPVRQYCDEHSIRHRTLMTPSDNVFYQLGAYNKNHPDALLSREEFILKCWREEWHLA